MTATPLIHRISIRRPTQVVFDYATTPGRWPEWHPSSLHLGPGTEHPLPTGARFQEDVRAGGRKGQLFWNVRQCDPPRRWVADAHASNGAQLTLTYTMSPEGDGTLFERTLKYEMPNAWLRLLDRLLLRGRIEKESAESLRRLRQVLEATR